MVRWERWKGSEVASGKGDRVVSWGGGRFLFYSRVWNAGRVQDFIFLYLMLINGTQGVDFLACPQGWKDTPKNLRELSKTFFFFFFLLGSHSTPGIPKDPPFLF